MEQNVVIAVFPEKSKTFEAFSELKKASGINGFEMINAVVVTHNFDGSFNIQDAVGSGTFDAATYTGTLLGALIGVLGGPLGVLMGGAIGMLVGEVAGASAEDDNESILRQVTRFIPRGKTALISEMNEQDEKVVNEKINALGGFLIRRPVVDVEAEISVHEAAVIAAVKRADEVMRKKHKEERHEKWSHWKAELKDTIAKIKEKF